MGHCHRSITILGIGLSAPNKGQVTSIPKPMLSDPRVKVLMATDFTTGSLHVPDGVSCMTNICKRPSVSILLLYSGYKMEGNKRTSSLCCLSASYLLETQKRSWFTVRAMCPGYSFGFGLPPASQTKHKLYLFHDRIQ